MHFKKFLSLTVMYLNSFVCLFKLTINPICTIFHPKHYVVNLNNINQFPEVGKILTTIRSCIDGQTYKNNRMHKRFWTLLECVRTKKKVFTYKFIRKHSWFSKANLPYIDLFILKDEKNRNLIFEIIISTLLFLVLGYEK